MADRWQDAEIVELPPPLIPKAECPNCGWESRTIVRSTTCGDGSVTRRCKCNRCSSRFIELQLPPGEDDDYGRFIDAAANRWQNEVDNRDNGGINPSSGDFT